MISPTSDDLRVASCIGIPIAICATLFRTYLRRKTYWWDDFFALVSMTGIIFMWIGILMFTSPPEHHSRHFKVLGYYFVDNGFYATIWPARISILSTILRLTYPGRFRQILQVFFGLFLLVWAIMDAQIWWTCEQEVEWKDRLVAQCMLGKEVAIAQLITDSATDLLLIAAPMYLFSTLTSRRSLKIRLLTVFSSTILTTVFSLVHAYAILHDLGYLEFMFAVIEIVVSLVVVNLTVITSWLFKLTDTDEDTEPAHINTFMKHRISGRSRAGTQGLTNTIGLSAMTPAHVDISTTTERHVAFAKSGELEAGSMISSQFDEWKKLNKDAF
ncbi:hypothetical protein D9758_010485 [Tetrapyrgos nigripes]|uniref:Rhodopsin domain-containing protein n=1 Tax=Tetrapyrgos nigripes TaxID=182062 RepID=A0A8H5CZK1_9AGAR|nr:hypothetical protein D9758_010485 [Tetrapyrgos nigripes]